MEEKEQMGLWGHVEKLLAEVEELKAILARMGEHCPWCRLQGQAYQRAGVSQDMPVACEYQEGIGEG